MPNHIHGIVKINESVVTGHALLNNKNNNLSNIVGSFKSAVTKQINSLNDVSFRWHRSFYEHIVRTAYSLNNIREYIRNNPEAWGKDVDNIRNKSLEGKACLARTG